jgi:hypothetical protein
MKTLAIILGGLGTVIFFLHWGLGIMIVITAAILLVCAPKSKKIVEKYVPGDPSEELKKHWF